MSGYNEDIWETHDCRLCSKFEIMDDLAQALIEKRETGGWGITSWLRNVRLFNILTFEYFFEDWFDDVWPSYTPRSALPTPAVPFVTKPAKFTEATLLAEIGDAERYTIATHGFREWAIQRRKMLDALRVAAYRDIRRTGYTPFPTQVIDWYLKYGFANWWKSSGDPEPTFLALYNEAAQKWTDSVPTKSDIPLDENVCAVRHATYSPPIEDKAVWIATQRVTRQFTGLPTNVTSRLDFYIGMSGYATSTNPSNYITYEFDDEGLGLEENKYCPIQSVESADATRDLGYFHEFVPKMSQADDPVWGGLITDSWSYKGWRSGIYNQSEAYLSFDIPGGFTYRGPDW